MGPGMWQSPCKVRDAEAGRWCPDLFARPHLPCCVPSFGIISWARPREGQLVCPEWHHWFLLSSSEALLTRPFLLCTIFSV